MVAEDGAQCFRWLSGVGTRYDLVCRECADGPDPEARLIEVCEGCAGRARSVLGWRGEVRMVRRDRDLAGTWAKQDCPIRPVDHRGVAPLPDGWLVLSGDDLVSVPDGRVVATVHLTPEEAGEGWAGRVRGPVLHTSPDGRFAAVVRDYGRYGVVVDLADGRAVLELDRGDYYVETTSFPFAFLGGRVVAATGWNRLDVFEPTGRLLTPRRTEPEPEEDRDGYLDYFQGRLSASPSGRWLLADGWVWHPIGMPAVVDVESWLGGEVHAAEHPVMLDFRGWAWDLPVAWVDERTVAVQGIGDDDPMLDGVQLYTLPDGRCVGAFAGPVGPMWTFGGVLYSSGPDGLAAWDPVDGVRTGLPAGFRPVAHNPVTGAFAELSGGVLTTWTPVPIRAGTGA